MKDVPQKIAELSEFNPFTHWTDEHIIDFLAKSYYEEDENVFILYCQNLFEARPADAAGAIIAAVARRIDQRSRALGNRPELAGQSVGAPAAPSR